MRVQGIRKALFLCGIFVGAVLGAARAVTVCAEEYIYDDLNRVILVIYEDGGTVEYVYDRNGNIIKTIVSPEASEDLRGTRESGETVTSESNGDSDSADAFAETEDSEAKNPEMKDSETKEVETEPSAIKDLETKDLETKGPETEDSEPSLAERGAGENGAASTGGIKKLLEFIVAFAAGIRRRLQSFL